MAEIKPYSFESMQNSSESEEDTVHKSQDKRRSVYASVVRSRTEKGNKRKNVYDARRSIEEAAHKISGEYFFLYSADVNYFGTRKIINSHRIGDLFHLFRILL